ncbi:MAG: hypothetical protein EPN85_02370 [Bacteroidetes bacterium]|nr:MAG: hypothetical protein EPN85_02370 [Bacteroidota bacterium]
MSRVFVKADKLEDIQKFLESIPDKYDILDEGIDIQIQKEYIEQSHTFDRGELTEKEILGLSNILFDKNASVDKKKKALVLLAHLGTVEAFRQIEKYNNYSENELKQWTLLSLQECKMFLESSLLDESSGFISTGLGGLDNRLRYYFVVTTVTDKPFTDSQKNIIRDEYKLVCKELNCVMESTGFFDTFIGLTVLVSFDVAVGDVIENGIKKCNDLGEFVFGHYFVTNVKVPGTEEILDIIKDIKGKNK